MRALTALLLAAALAAAATSCGGDDDESESVGGAVPATGGSGALRFAVPQVPQELDPLEATTRGELLVVSQVHEPLVDQLRPPYLGERNQSESGLATSITPSRSRAEWTIELRPGVSFQDGTPLDVPALLFNARRWISSPAGDDLLPGAFAADSPRPEAVRLLFASPADGVRRLLASPRLGLVSPETGAGTGPFEFAGRDDDSLELEPFPGWWGSPLGLGPALDSVSFVPVADPRRRVALLAEGSVEAADAPGAAGVREASADPLLRSSGGPQGRAYSAAVRGLDVPDPYPALSAVWLTTIGG